MPIYSFAMITMDQLPSPDSQRAVLRPLTPVEGGTGTITLQRQSFGSLPSIDSRRLTRILGRPVAVPNWVVALTVATTVGVSAMLSQGLVSAPVSTVAQPARPATTLVSMPLPGAGLPSLVSPAIITQGPSSGPKLAELRGEIQSMNGDLQDVQRQNDALRNLTHQQSASLTSAQANLAASQDRLNGASQDLGAGLTTLKQEVDGRVPGLQSGLKSASDLVNQIRKLLGMPTITLP